jgi:hypothetical protein
VANREADGQQSADAAASAALRYARPVAAGLLLLIVIAGIGAVSPAVSGLGPLRRDALGLGIGSEVVLAGLEVALIVMERRRSGSGNPAAALRHMLRRVIAVLMIVIILIAIANFEANNHGNLIQRWFLGGRRPQQRKSARLLRLPAGTRTGTADDVSYALYGLIGLIVLAAVVAAVILVWRSRKRLHGPIAYADETADEASADLREAVDSARVALRAVDDARAAIIACYVAMEDTLASAGTARAIAETPDELLTRAAGAGLIRGAAAAALTGLFYEARFSSHPMPATARDTARQALDDISAELAGRAGPGPASPTSAGLAR